MDISEDPLCLFTGQVEERDGSYVIEIPEREVAIGDVAVGDVSRIALLPPTTGTSTTGGSGPSQPDGAEPQPPVEEGDVLDVEIEDIGDQGDGIARVGPGYVVIVSDTERGERVSVEITEVRENVAFAEVVERYDQMA